MTQSQLRFALQAILVSAFVAPCWSQETQVAIGPPETKKAIEQINEASVTGTISFLASDELGGRGTGSTEFNIAAAYVASRFRAAGLKPAGDEESYYHTTNRVQKKMPNKVSVKDANGKSLLTFGLLASAPERFEYNGEVATLDLAKLDDLEKVSGVVCGAFDTTAKGSRAMSQLTRVVQRLEALGAKAVLLKTSSDSEWANLADQMASKPFLDSRSPLNIPVVLVSADAERSTSVSMDIPPAIRVEQPMRNVIGVIPGTDPELSKECVLFTAHLDHLGTMTHAGDNIYNGADDDASGVTAVLTLADAFANAPAPKRSIVFMTFWGEESGLLGSKEFVARPTWPLERICANINIEMIGRPEDGARGKIWVTGWNESDLGKQMHEAAHAWGGDIFEHPKFSAMLYRSSDNWSFAQSGVIAHSFSAGSLHADYHKPDDEWDRLEIPHMTQVIRNLFVGSLPLASGEVTPKKTAK